MKYRLASLGTSPVEPRSTDDERHVTSSWVKPRAGPGAGIEVMKGRSGRVESAPSLRMVQLKVCRFQTVWWLSVVVDNEKKNHANNLGGATNMCDNTSGLQTHWPKEVPRMGHNKPRQSRWHVHLQPEISMIDYCCTYFCSLITTIDHDQPATQSRLFKLTIWQSLMLGHPTLPLRTGNCLSPQYVALTQGKHIVNQPIIPKYSKCLVKINENWTCLKPSASSELNRNDIWNHQPDWCGSLTTNTWQPGVNQKYAKL